MLGCKAKIENNEHKEVLSHGNPGKIGGCCGLGTDRTIKFSSEAVRNNISKGLGFSGVIEEVMKSPSLNCASLPREVPKNSRSLIRVT
jgi:hypothetical protein